MIRATVGAAGSNWKPNSISGTSRTETLRKSARHGSTLPSRAATCNDAAGDDHRRALAVVTFLDVR